MIILKQDLYMKTINVEDLVSLINDYANAPVDKPLFVFGERYDDGRWQILEKTLGESYWKICNEKDDPRKDIPYCLYNTYYGAACNSTLYRCIEIAKQIHRPMFCFIDNSVKDKVPEEIIAEYGLYNFTNQ